MPATAVRPPRINITNVPWMRPGMGLEGAYKSGYRHGYEGYNTTAICSLTHNTDERREWMKGYYEGATDKAGE